MADHCIVCDIRRPVGGTKIVVVNNGQSWLEFCPACSGEIVTNAETGEKITLEQLWQRGRDNTAPSTPEAAPAPVFGEFNEYNDHDATACACGDYNAFEEREVFNDHEGFEHDTEAFDQFEACEY